MGDYFSTPEHPSDEKPKYEKPKGRQKAHLIFINPYSGNKKSMKIFQETLEPLLKERRIFYEVRVTQKPKEVEEFFQTSTAISLREKYSAIVILSADGLLFEAIQGLYQRTTSLEEESP